MQWLGITTLHIYTIHWLAALEYEHEQTQTVKTTSHVTAGVRGDDTQFLS